jgi:hypothetical protein
MEWRGPRERRKRRSWDRHFKSWYRRDSVARVDRGRDSGKAQTTFVSGAPFAGKLDDFRFNNDHAFHIGMRG